MRYLSFVVDNLPLHYYQAELLLFSIKKFTSFNKNNIVIHCTTRVTQEFLSFLKEDGYTYKIIEPFLDGKYCNKLQQLNSFIHLTEDDSVFLIDTDTFFLNNPIVESSSLIGGKVVDAPNPPLRVLKSIFDTANIPYPPIVPSDWIMKNSDTFECNFNGGFYYIPGKDIDKVNSIWRKWATWLYEKPTLFETKAQRIHVDQVSFTMMIQDAQFEYQVLISNNNCPIHYNLKQRLFDEEKEVSLIHYHRSLNCFGFLESNLLISPIVTKAIEKINSTIREKEELFFFKNFNKSLFPSTISTEKSQQFEERLSLLIDDRLKNKEIIFHAGTPKTGTTTLQFLFDEKHNDLLEEGILYPKHYIGTYAPKHQWLVPLLRKNDFDKLLIYLERVFIDAKKHNVKKIFLSTEGIYNHWWDFSSEAKEVLKIISKYFNLKLYIVFRNPLSFLESFYKQNLKNPQNNAAECYGKDFDFSDMFNDKWFIKHIDYLGFIQECESVFGKNNIKILPYSREIIHDILDLIGSEILPSTESRNVSHSNISMELIRVVNRYNLSASDKKIVVKDLQKLDSIFSNYNSNALLSEEDKSNVNNLFSLQEHILKKEYNITLNK